MLQEQVVCGSANVDDRLVFRTWEVEDSERSGQGEVCSCVVRKYLDVDVVTVGHVLQMNKLLTHHLGTTDKAAQCPFVDDRHHVRRLDPVEDLAALHARLDTTDNVLFPDGTASLEDSGGVFGSLKSASAEATRTPDGVVAKHETNVVLSDAGQAGDAEALLEAIGMVRLVRVDKARTTWCHPARENATVTVDTVTGAGVFVEVEIISGDADRAAADLAETEADLGLAGCPVVALPYWDIVRQAAR